MRVTRRINRRPRVDLDPGGNYRLGAGSRAAVPRLHRRQLPVRVVKGQVLRCHDLRRDELRRAGDLWREFVRHDQPVDVDDTRLPAKRIDQHIAIARIRMRQPRRVQPADRAGQLDRYGQIVDPPSPLTFMQVVEAVMGRGEPLALFLLEHGNLQQAVKPWGKLKKHIPAFQNNRIFQLDLATFSLPCPDHFVRALEDLSAIQAQFTEALK